MSEHYFSAELMFEDLDGALAARHEFVRLGFVVKDLDYIDPCGGPCAWIDINIPSETDLWRQVDEIADAFDGSILEGGLLTHEQLGRLEEG